MERQPLFSILIANYNNGIYLEDAINSVFRQTYNNWEIIIVDDCSTDGSKNVYQKYVSDSRIHVFYNDQNHGCGYTKRRCAELANGEICGFLDPDDTLEPEALGTMVKIHEKDESLSMVYSRYNEVDENLNYIRVSTQQKDIPDGSSFLNEGYCISHFVTFKITAYKQTPGIDPHFLRAVDHDMYLMLEEVGKVKFIDKPLYNYRTNTGQNISLGENGKKAYLWHLIGMVDACRRRDLPVEDYVLKDFLSWISATERKERVKGQKEGQHEITQSKSYRVGHTLLTPFRFIKHIAKSKHHKV